MSEELQTAAERLLNTLATDHSTAAHDAAVGNLAVAAGVAEPAAPDLDTNARLNRLEAIFADQVAAYDKEIADAKAAEDAAVAAAQADAVATGAPAITLPEPAPAVTHNADGTTTTEWQDGSFEITSADGTVLTERLPAADAPVEPAPAGEPA